MYSVIHKKAALFLPFLRGELSELLLDLTNGRGDLLLQVLQIFKLDLQDSPFGLKLARGLLKRQASQRLISVAERVRLKWSFNMVAA
jgi:hypothetical protein